MLWQMMYLDKNALLGLSDPLYGKRPVIWPREDKTNLLLEFST